MSSSSPQVITLAAGCFWCVEAILTQVDGVLSARSGFMGGHMQNPTYKDVCTLDTGHAEVVQVEFDPAKVSLAELLEWFWRLHDPTTLNRQGNDVGTQYRSAIFAHSDADLSEAKAALRAKQASGAFADPITTSVSRADAFYAADSGHDDYYRRNRDQGYCKNVIAPKLKKLNLES